MNERLRFVARLLDGEKMAALCREFDVSRKTGYKIFQRCITRTLHRSNCGRGQTNWLHFRMHRRKARRGKQRKVLNNWLPDQGSNLGPAD